MSNDVLARHPLPAKYANWNRSWGAPSGRRRRLASLLPGNTAVTLATRFPQVVGPFAYQPNNKTRQFEYPWAYFAMQARSGMRAVEIGGSLSGMQFVLASEGVEVTNIDPGEASRGVGWPVDADTIRDLNRAFSTDVLLVSSTLQEAALASGSFDIVYSISTIEHIPADEHPSLMAEINRVLKPGGICVLTIDLFLNLVPFSDRDQNDLGFNVDIAQLVEWSGLSLRDGVTRELLGFPDFDHKAVMADLEHLSFGSYPACAQCLVLQK